MSYPKSSKSLVIKLLQFINYQLIILNAACFFQVNILCSRAQTCSEAYAQGSVLQKPPENAGSKRRYSSWVHWTKTECCLHGVKANESRKKWVKVVCGSHCLANLIKTKTKQKAKTTTERIEYILQKITDWLRYKTERRLAEEAWKKEFTWLPQGTLPAASSSVYLLLALTLCRGRAVVLAGKDRRLSKANLAICYRGWRELGRIGKCLGVLASVLGPWFFSTWN